MAAIWIEPYVNCPSIPGGSFAGGVAGGFPQTDSTTRSQTTLYALGTLARDAAGNEYIYVKAGATIPINSAVKANADLSDVRVTAAAGDAFIGVADAAFALNDNGFILSRGTTNVITAGAIAANTLLSPAAAGSLAAMAAADLVAKPAFVLVNSATPQKVRLL